MRSVLHSLLGIGLCLAAVGCSDGPSAPPSQGGAGANPGGAGGAAPGGKVLRIAVIPKGTTHDFWKSVHAGALDAAQEATGVQVIWNGPDNEKDKEQQIKIVDTFVNDKVDGICIAPIDRDALIEPIRRAKEAGIPVVVFDSGLSDTSHIVSYVATDNYHYLQYSPPNFIGQHVSRFTLVDGKLDPASEKLLLKYEEQRRECCHHAGSLQFGPRGELFIATGDNTNPFDDSQSYAPIDERPGREPWDAQKSSSNTNSYNGKILRIRPTPEGGYEIPEGNLFPADGSQGRPEIYVMGCRNPWRISVDPVTGHLYWGDVGPDAQAEGPRGPRGYDEVNQARKAGNFGWPYFVANNQA